MKMETKYVSKEQLYSKFGWADIQNQIAYVRNDLPKPVKNFVTAHEKYHLSDKATWWVWREIKANTYAGVRHPWGFVITVIMSMAPHRIIYYIDRIRKNQ